MTVWATVKAADIISWRNTHLRCLKGRRICPGLQKQASGCRKTSQLRRAEYLRATINLPNTTSTASHLSFAYPFSAAMSVPKRTVTAFSITSLHDWISYLQSASRGFSKRNRRSASSRTNTLPTRRRLAMTALLMMKAADPMSTRRRQP